MSCKMSKMQFKFDSNLEYQLEAIQAVVDLFQGQQDTSKDFPFIAENGVVPNELSLSKQDLLDNVQSIQKQNSIEKVGELQGMDFSVEMETGTGKTYVYLRSILDLNKHYGFKKFIIIVPSVAIREGVLKTIEITKQHFKRLYNNVPYNFSEYDSSNLSQVRQFARNNNIEILVMTLDSFNKDSNIMNRHIDRLSGQKPIDLVSRTNPILILDEPQNMESKKSKEALENLNPLCKLRYSATHRNYYNLLYRLTPVDAYTKGLVKKIEVLSVIKEDDFNAAYIRCIDIKADSKEIAAKLELNVKQKSGFKEKVLTIRHGDDLAEKTDNPEYDGFVVSEIRADYEYIKFSNGHTLKLGEDQGSDRKQLMRAQIKHTIQEHFRKQEALKDQNLKVLSLFFIDRVDNYVKEDGFIRKTFVEEFNRIQKEFGKDLDVDEIHAGYFATKTNGEYYDDASTTYMQRNKEAFDLIMKDKEQLLSFEEPTQFIFSHSALREGWDNPNVFNICTLNESVSEIKKRQEIGRGVRLPVDQSGQRITDQEFKLTVVANESYAEYVAKLQNEYVDEYGEVIAPPKPPNARNRKKITLRKGYKLNQEFKELWERISKKTRYAVDINTDELIEECVQEINNLTVSTIKVRVEKVSLSLKEGQGIQHQLVGQAAEELDKKYKIPNLIELIARETDLTRDTIYTILASIDNIDLIFKNPKEFTQSVVLIIKEKLKEFLINGIQYAEIEEFWKMELFEDMDAYEEYVLPDSNKKTIYDGIIWDSKGEREFAQKLEENDKVSLFVKLPPWFNVQTPVGEYNPDWAVVLEQRDLEGEITEKLYLVRETKFVDNLDNLRPSEKYKIKCAEEHFKAVGVDFNTINDFDKLSSNLTIKASEKA